MARVGRYLRRLLYPWKLVTLAAGTAFFVWGAYFFDAPTWDVGVSLLMSGLCFLLAPLALDLVLGALRGRSRPLPRLLRLLAGAALVYLVGSGSYELYHLLVNGRHPVTYWENLLFSLPVAVCAGLLWRLDGTLSQLAGWLRRGGSGQLRRDGSGQLRRGG